MKRDFLTDFFITVGCFIILWIYALVTGYSSGLVWKFLMVRPGFFSAIACSTVALFGFFRPNERAAADKIDLAASNNPALLAITRRLHLGYRVIVTGILALLIFKMSLHQRLDATPAGVTLLSMFGGISLGNYIRWERVNFRTKGQIKGAE